MYSPTRGQIGVLKEVLFNDLLWILGEKNEKYNISSGPYMENEFIFETVIKDKANNKIYNLKREIDILFVEQGKTRRWTFDH